MLDLFTPVVAVERQSPNFAALLFDEMADVRQVVQGWSSDFQDRDGNFVVEFQTKFNQQFWELYLHTVFKECGCEPSYPFERPDYLLQIMGEEVVAEATTTQHVPTLAPEWVRDSEDFATADVRAIFHHGTIRFGNSFTGKLQKYKESYSKLGHVQGKPFLLAIGHYEQPLFYFNGHVPALRVLFGLDEPLHISNGDSEYLVGLANRPSEWKSSETEVEFGFFRDDRAKEISAVLVSSLATVGKCHALSDHKADDRLFFSTRFASDGSIFAQFDVGTDYQETIADGLHLFVNPNAELALDWTPFHDAGISVHVFSEVDGYEVKTRGTNLSTRWTLGFKDADNEKWEALRARARTAKAQRIQRPSLPIWEDGRLVPQAVLAVFMGHPLHDQHHLAHYKGWTIHVCRDVTDQDWFGQAVLGIHVDVQGVINQNQREEVLRKPSGVEMVSSLATKESALRAMADQIDKVGRIGGDV